MKQASNIALLCASLLALPAYADESTAEQAEYVSPWKASIELGYLRQSGNNDNTSLNSKFDVTYEVTNWRNHGIFEAVAKSESDTTTSERYLLSLQSDYKFNDRQYLFVLGSYEDDRFSGYEYQQTLALGYGHRLVKTPTVVLDLEIGPGYRVAKIDEDAAEDAGEKESSAILRSAMNLDWHLSKTALFEQDLSAESGDDNTVWKSVSAVKAQLMNQLAMKFSYTVKHITDVPEGSENTDTETAITLVYNF